MFAPGRLSCREGGELLPWSMCIEDLRAPLAIDYSFCSRFGRRPASSSRSSGTSYDPLSICSRMRRACASNLDETNSSAGPVGYGPSPAPLRSTGMPSASSRPLTISPSTHDWVQNTDTKSSPTHPSCHHANPQSEARSSSSSLVAKPPQSVLSRWQGTRSWIGSRGPHAARCSPTLEGGCTEVTGHGPDGGVRQINAFGIWRDLIAPVHAPSVCSSRNSTRDLRVSS